MSIYFVTMESILERGTISTSCKNTFHSHHNNNNNIKTYSGSLLQNWWVSSTGTILDHLCKSMFYYILPQFMILFSDMSSPRNRKPRALYFINRTFCLLFICPMQHYHIHLFEHYQLCLFCTVHYIQCRPWEVRKHHRVLSEVLFTKFSKETRKEFY